MKFIHIEKQIIKLFLVYVADLDRASRGSIKHKNTLVLHRLIDYVRRQYENANKNRQPHNVDLVVVEYSLFIG